MLTGELARVYTALCSGSVAIAAAALAVSRPELQLGLDGAGS
jgi:hypothetical protein